ncbi:hypothetical protein CKAH01_04788 [Colletotrichum kahawae]|uniref:Uncharacterized protein n=1 Tax=Colletotrichum kahawae TaxID=34407 RepID=A0AAD9YHT5_COLKA|nr:hypothetical protein CKAH01_04788 [Colletotrichum kahawae]
MKTIEYQIDELESESGLSAADALRSEDSRIRELEALVVKAASEILGKLWEAHNVVGLNSYRYAKSGLPTFQKSIDRRNIYNDVDFIVFAEVGERAKSFGAADVLGDVYKADTLRKLNGRRTVD